MMVQDGNEPKDAKRKPNEPRRVKMSIQVAFEPAKYVYLVLKGSTVILEFLQAHAADVAQHFPELPPVADLCLYGRFQCGYRYGVQCISGHSLPHLATAIGLVEGKSDQPRGLFVLNRTLQDEFGNRFPLSTSPDRQFFYLQSRMGGGQLIVPVSTARVERTVKVRVPPTVNSGDRVQWKITGHDGLFAFTMPAFAGMGLRPPYVSMTVTVDKAYHDRYEYDGTEIVSVLRAKGEGSAAAPIAVDDDEPPPPAPQQQHAPPPPADEAQEQQEARELREAFNVPIEEIERRLQVARTWTDWPWLDDDSVIGLPS